VTEFTKPKVGDLGVMTDCYGESVWVDYMGSQSWTSSWRHEDMWHGDYYLWTDGGVVHLGTTKS